VIINPGLKPRPPLGLDLMGLGGSWNRFFYHYINRGHGAMTTLAINALDIFAVPFVFGQDGVTIDTVAIDVSTAGSVDAAAKVGIYRAVSYRDDYPGALVQLSSELTGLDSTGVKTFGFAPVQYYRTGVLYWVVMMFNNMTTGPVLRAQTAANQQNSMGLAMASRYDSALGNFTNAPVNGAIGSGSTYPDDLANPLMGGVMALGNATMPTIALGLSYN
jgi:hypothetical protein